MRQSVSSSARLPARASAWAVLWLVLSLLFTQWLGYAHAVGHAGARTEALSSQGPSGLQSLSFDHQKAGSTCASLDAATLGASLHNAAFVLLLLPAAAALAAAIAKPSWLQAFTALFSSRAPPSRH